MCKNWRRINLISNKKLKINWKLVEQVGLLLSSFSPLLVKQSVCLPYVPPSLILKNPTLFFLGLEEQTAVMLCSNFGDTNKCTNAFLILLSSSCFAIVGFFRELKPRFR